jgi:peptidoglycan/LPS O-acetylase OafA/YrhL
MSTEGAAGETASAAAPGTVAPVAPAPAAAAEVDHVDELDAKGAEPTSGRHATRLPTLTGLRFLAALSVFFFHAALPFPNIRLFADDGVASDFYEVFAPAGGLGVTFFFVLSGFILTWSARPGDRARSFWRRRAAKVVPSYLAAWVLALVLIGTGTQTLQAVLTFFMVQSWVPDLNIAWAVNAPGWSLSTEALFYLAFPALYHFAKRIPARHLRFWVIGVVAGIAATCLFAYAFIPAGEAVVPNEPHHSADQFWFAYVFPVARLLDFALGILVARAVLSDRWRGAGMAWSGVLLLAAYVASYYVPLLYGLRLLCVVPAAMLIAAAAVADGEGRFTPFRNRAMTWLGEISYAFYLTHFIVVIYTRTLLGDRLFSTPVGIALLAAQVAVSVLISWALYAGVERPLTRRWSRSRRAADLGATSGSTGAVVGTRS